MLTFAQNFEDVMLERLFQFEGAGFYVDVGAWHPDKFSVTKHFYERGWSGLNIEPIRELWSLFEQDRPRDINLQVAVASRDSEAEQFFECVDDTSLSTTDPVQAVELQRRGLTLAIYEIPVKSLQSLLDEYCPAQEIDFLKIDVEGGESRVIDGIDWTRTRPKVLVIEATKPATPVTDWSRLDHLFAEVPWERQLISIGYQMAHFDGLSRFYLREDQAHKGGRLVLPPGVYDSLSFPVEKGLREQIDLIDRDRERRRELLEHVSSELAACEHDRAQRLQLVTELTSQLSEVEADRAARLKLVEQLSREISTIEADRAARLAMIEDLNARLQTAELALQKKP